ncbi:MAG TPA: multicopper oxidase family protein [Terriglobales bacterium]|nr:multicopper oxidase family protein [Terriglobales bacterium]
MKAITTKNAIETIEVLLAALTSLVLLLTLSAHAAAPGVKGTSFNLSAKTAYLTQPDGQMIYSWGYSCDGGGSPVPFGPSSGNACGGSMQVPGPTLIVTEGDTVHVTLTNNLPAAAGNTSILFPGFDVTAVCATTVGCPQGLLTTEVAPGRAVTYTFTASSPGTRAYYSGTQGDLQVEMGLYGVIIVLPKNVPGNCTSGTGNFAGHNGDAEAFWHELDYRLAPAAYDHPDTCYDREYLFQFSEIDPNIHYQAEAQVAAKTGCTAGTAGCSLDVATEPYHPVYYMINGRSMPDLMDPNYAPEYPHQPYNGNPHMHPGELVLLRIVGQGRWQHPFHEHANHVRILGRDGNLILSSGTVNYPSGSAQGLAGPLLFTTTTTPGLAMDGIFYYTGKGLNWDMYGHNPSSSDSSALLPCIPDANGYNTLGTSYKAINYYEWCQDHNKALEAHPVGDVSGGGPVTLPDPNILTNGAWYGGSAYLGPNATGRAVGPTGTTPPSGTIANSPSTEAGFAFMWHSHNEREITTNNAFPGGMMMMMLVDSREFVIDESN